MQQNAKVISVEIDISIPKQDGSGSYKGSRLVYTDDSGKIQTQAFHENTFKFNMALKQQLKELKAGDQVVIDKEKPEGSSFWKVNGILKQTGVVSGQMEKTSATSWEGIKPNASPKSTYETPEERAKKQVYIVRQSSLSSAISLLQAGAAQDKKTVINVDTVLGVAKQFEDYVFGNNNTPKFSDDFPGDEGEVF